MSLGRSISNLMGICSIILLSFMEIPVCNANTVDPDQIPHCPASDLGLHWLPRFLLWDTRH